jgi:hypothetical protein
MQNFDLASADERDLRKLALEMKLKLKEWFTESQVSKLYGNEQRKDIIGSLIFIGLVEAGAVDGTWKYRVIDSPERRVDILKQNVKQLEESISQDQERKAYLEGLIPEIEKEI